MPDFFTKLTNIALINLLFAQAEMVPQAEDDAAARALYHIQLAEGCIRLVADSIPAPEQADDDTSFI